MNGEIDMAQLNEAYNILTEKLASIQEAKGDPSYKFDVVDLEIESTNLKDGEVKLTMSSALGNLPVGFNYSFGPTDYWIWGRDLGKCGDYTGQEIGKDAAEQLEIRMNAATSSPGYFTEVVYRDAYPSDFPDPNYPGQWQHYKMFSMGGNGSGPNEEPCLNPTELIYYMSNWPEIRNYLKPEGKTFKNVLVWDTYTLGVGYWQYIHLYRMSFGIFHSNNPS